MGSRICTRPHLLVPPLHAAVSAVQCGHVAIGVTHQLDLQVTALRGRRRGDKGRGEGRQKTQDEKSGNDDRGLQRTVDWTISVKISEWRSGGVCEG